MATVRIAHVDPRPGNVGEGRVIIAGFLVVLTDDAGHRALPMWLASDPGLHSLWQLTEPDDVPGAAIVTAVSPEEFIARLLSAAGAEVAGVDVEITAASLGELTQAAATARIEIVGPDGPGSVPARLGLGLALAAAADAPVRVADAVLDRLAVPVVGDDWREQFADLVPAEGRWPSVQHPQAGDAATGDLVVTIRTGRLRYEPRNLDFADGLDRWDLDGSFRRAAGGSDAGDYAAAADGESANLAAASAAPRGSAELVQPIFADDFRGRVVTFSAEVRTEDLADEGGLRLEVVRLRKFLLPVREDHGVVQAGRNDWARQEISALIPADADVIRFGIALRGAGRVALRRAELRVAEFSSAEPCSAELSSAEPRGGEAGDLPAGGQ
jgi:hypothetical protein